MNRTILALGGVNLVLAAYLAYAFFSRSAAAPSESAAPAVAVEANSGKSVAKTRLRPRLAPAAPEPFHWRSLASDDLKQFVSNLRGVQCPEETIRDMVVAEVNRRFAPRERALKVQPEDFQPWETASSRDRRSNEGKWRELLAEKRAMLKELLGVDVPVELSPSLAGRNVGKYEPALAALPEGKREAARVIQEKYWSQSDEIKRRTLGILEPEDYEEFARIKRERREEMSKLLTPEELDQYEIATSTTALMLRSQMGDFKATDEEFRKIFKLSQVADEEFGIGRGARDPEDTERNEKRKQAERELQEQVRTLLGDERFTELERARDPVYRGISRAVEQAGLPKDSAVQAYEASKLVREEANRVMADASLSLDQRVQALTAIQAEAEKALHPVLGDKGLEAFRKFSNATRPNINLGNSARIIRQLGPDGSVVQEVIRGPVVAPAPNPQ